MVTRLTLLVLLLVAPAAAGQATDLNASEPELDSDQVSSLLDPRTVPGTASPIDRTASPTVADPAVNTSPDSQVHEAGFQTEGQNVARDDPVTAVFGMSSLLGFGALMIASLPIPRRSNQRTTEQVEDDEDSGPTFLDRDELAEGIEEEPVDHPGARGALLLGHQAIQQDKLQAGAAWFEAAHHLDPTLEIAYILKALCLEEAGHHGRALRAVDQAARIAPGDAACLYLRARLLACAGDREGARQQLAHLREALPGVTGFVLEDPRFQELHDDPRYLSQVGRLNEKSEDPDHG